MGFVDCGDHDDHDDADDMVKNNRGGQVLSQVVGVGDCGDHMVTKIIVVVRCSHK